MEEPERLGTQEEKKNPGLSHSILFYSILTAEFQCSVIHTQKCRAHEWSTGPLTFLWSDLFTREFSKGATMVIVLASSWAYTVDDLGLNSIKMSFDHEIIGPSLLSFNYLPFSHQAHEGQWRRRGRWEEGQRLHLAGISQVAQNFDSMTEEPDVYLDYRADLGVPLSSVSVRTGAGAHPLCSGTVRPGWRDGLHVGTGLASWHHSLGLGPAKGKRRLTGSFNWKLDSLGAETHTHIYNANWSTNFYLKFYLYLPPGIFLKCNTRHFASPGMLWRETTWRFRQS